MAETKDLHEIQTIGLEEFKRQLTQEFKKGDKTNENERGIPPELLFITEITDTLLSLPSHLVGNYYEKIYRELTFILSEHRSKDRDNRQLKFQQECVLTLLRQIQENTLLKKPILKRKSEEVLQDFQTKISLSENGNSRLRSDLSLIPEIVDHLRVKGAVFLTQTMHILDSTLNKSYSPNKRYRDIDINSKKAQFMEKLVIQLATQRELKDVDKEEDANPEITQIQTSLGQTIQNIGETVRSEDKTLEVQARDST